MQNSLKCTLHREPFTLYCDQCLEVICHKCTILGPHNSATHSVCHLAHAYQRRVQEINNRLHSLIQNRDHILNEIGFLISVIESSKTKKVQIDSENEKVQSKLQTNLNKSFENIAQTITKTQQQFYEQISLINDLGHEFESLSESIDTVIAYPKIIDEMKQISDKIQILLNQAPETVVMNELPRQLTDLRIKLREMDSLQGIYKKKQQVIQNMINLLQNDLKKIQAPVIDYAGYLDQLNQTLLRFQRKGFICYFCGIIMNDDTINSKCEQNQLNEQINKISKERGAAGAMLDGYGQIKPENSKFGSHRHYFCEPGDENAYYRAVFLDEVALGEESQENKYEIYKELNNKLHVIKGQSNKTIFSFYLDALLLKIKTLEKIKGKNLKLLLQKEDSSKDGRCDKIGLEYVMMEIIGLSESETSIIKAILEDSMARQAYKYPRLIQKLNTFYI